MFIISQMDQVNVLLHAYYEALYEILSSQRGRLAALVERILNKMLADACQDRLRYQAYLDACLAFVDERLEAYNPIGFQYTFDCADRISASVLELHLDWFDSADEYKDLQGAASLLAEPQMSDTRLRELANVLIRQHGAFPNRSIIRGFEQAPGLNKLPDYVVATAIEGLLKELNI